MVADESVKLKRKYLLTGVGRGWGTAWGQSLCLACGPGFNPQHRLKAVELSGGGPAHHHKTNKGPAGIEADMICLPDSLGLKGPTWHLPLELFSEMGFTAVVVSFLPSWNS